MEFSPDIIEKLPKLEIFSDFTENTEDNLRILKKSAMPLRRKLFQKAT